MILPVDLTNFLADLFLSSGMSREEVGTQLQSLDVSFHLLLTARFLKIIPEKQQEELTAKIKTVKDGEEFLEILSKFFQDEVGQEQIKKIYQEELKKILEPILKPLREGNTPEQNAKLQALTVSYFRP